MINNSVKSNFYDNKKGVDKIMKFEKILFSYWKFKNKCVRFYYTCLRLFQQIIPLIVRCGYCEKLFYISLYMYSYSKAYDDYMKRSKEERSSDKWMCNKCRDRK